MGVCRNEKDHRGVPCQVVLCDEAEGRTPFTGYPPPPSFPGYPPPQPCMSRLDRDLRDLRLSFGQRAEPVLHAVRDARRRP